MMSYVISYKFYPLFQTFSQTFSRRNFQTFLIFSDLKKLIQSLPFNAFIALFWLEKGGAGTAMCQMVRMYEMYIMIHW